MAKRRDIAAKAAQATEVTKADTKTETPKTFLTSPSDDGGNTDALKSQLKKLKELSDDTDKSYQAMKDKQAADMKRLEDAIRNAEKEAEAKAKAKAKEEAEAKEKAEAEARVAEATEAKKPKAAKKDLFKKNGPAKVYRYWDPESHTYKTTPDYWAAEQMAPGSWKAIWVYYVDGEIDHTLTRDEFERYLPV